MNEPLPNVKNTIAVASGTGGVGKSTVAVNLAACLADRGASVGLMDCDIYGPSLPLMLGIAERPVSAPTTQLLTPLVKHGMKLMSMGFLSDERTPVIWRGPMVHKMVTAMMVQVDWGPLDYVVMDLPLGTGDAQLTLTQSAPLTGAVIVTTPQDVSLADARKGLTMFQQVNVPVLGIVENMSYFVCDQCDKRHEIFRHGGGHRTSNELGISFLGEIPLDPPVATGGDAGEPVVIASPDSPASKALHDVTNKVVEEINLAVEKQVALPTLG